MYNPKIKAVTSEDSRESERWPRNTRNRNEVSSKGFVTRELCWCLVKLDILIFRSPKATHIVFSIPNKCPTHAPKSLFSLFCLDTSRAHFAFSFILYVEHARSKVQVNYERFAEFFLVRFSLQPPDTVTIA